MPDQRPSVQRRHAERRRLFDRRSPLPRRTTPERRAGERRASSRPVARECRASRDRRAEARRELPDRRGLGRRVGPRRRETPTPFTADQVAELRALFAAPGAVGCPACGGPFALGRPRRRGDEIARRVRCIGCGRAAVVTNSRVARILVVEPKDVVRETLRAILAGAGHDVVEAADAGVGLAAYTVMPPDVVFLDAQASGQIGAAEFVRRLRREFPDARVVAMAGRSSYGVVDPLAVSQGLGAVHTVRMPFARDEVLRAVDQARA